ncbi:MAG: hypothetical protein ACJAU0_001083 [Flavobacteriales bacterium]|jgi:hypothetical protein
MKIVLLIGRILTHLFGFSQSTNDSFIYTDLAPPSEDEPEIIG